MLPRWIHHRLGIAGLVSLALHLSVVAGILLFVRRPVPLMEVPDKPVAVELVMEEQRGAGKTEVQAPPPVLTQPQPPVPTPPVEGEKLPAPAPAAPPAKPNETARPAPPKPVPEINIGGTDSESNAIVLQGPNVIPATPDKTVRNRPPVYPEEAARRGQQGSVVLVVRVGPSGLPSAVDVERSSGYTLLDKSAENAVMKWTFVPAVKDGLPVPYDFRMNFTFAFE